MRNFIYLFGLIMFDVGVALFVGKCTLTKTEIHLERPLLTIIVLFILLIVTFFGIVKTSK